MGSARREFQYEVFEFDWPRHTWGQELEALHAQGWEFITVQVTKDGLFVVARRRDRQA